MGIINTAPTVPTHTSADIVPRVMDHLGPFGIRPCSNFLSFSLRTLKVGSEYVVIYNGNTYTGSISPKSPITLPPEIKEIARIDKDATHFVWGYPSAMWSSKKEPVTSEEKFLSYGGYVYLEGDIIKGINGIENEGGQDLLFKGPYIFEDVQMIENLKKSNRLQKVTIASLQDKGIKEYCWLLPGECHSDGTSVISTHGAFVYLYNEGSFFFRVKGSLKTEEEIQNNTPIWEYSDRQDHWVSFNTKAHTILEEAFRADQPSAIITQLKSGEAIVAREELNEVQYTVYLDSSKPYYSCSKPQQQRKVRRIHYGSTRGSSVWAYSMTKNLTDIWVDFFSKSNTLTDSEYLKAINLHDNRPCLINITTDGKVTTYQLDFEKMLQTNQKTGHTRDIHRLTVGKLMNKPTPVLSKGKKKIRRLPRSTTLGKFHCYGDMAIQIKAAKDLAIVSTFGSCDPVVVVTTNFSSFFWKSPTRIMTVTPEWNQKLDMKVACDSLEGAAVIFTFYHYRLVQRNLYLGRMSISLFDIVNNKHMSGWRQLDYECREKNPCADPASVEFSISFTEGPPPALKSINMANLLPNGGEIASFENSEVMEGTHNCYKLTDVLGQGSFAVVRKGINLKDQKLVAVKVIKKSVREDFIDQIMCEIKIMGMMNNEYCVSIVDSRHTVQEIYIAMEFCSGGDMFDALISDKLAGEDNLKRPIKHILLGLNYLHLNYICHRDIKPENILFHSETKTWKIADFGISTFFSKDNPYIEGKEGTQQYMAPEIFIDGSKYTKSVDIWATGVVIYVSLTKRMPWPGSNEWEIEESITNYTPVFDDERISAEAIDFVYSLLRKNPDERSIDSALKHPWMR